MPDHPSRPSGASAASPHQWPPPRRSHFLLFALAWTVFTVYGSLVPLSYRSVALADAIERFRNLPPLGAGLGTRADWVANILLFIPLTFSWMGALVADRGKAARAGAAILLVPLACAGAIVLEFTQIWFGGRTVSRNDIVAESLGGLTGVLLWLGIGRGLVSWLRHFGRHQRPHSRFLWLLQTYLVGLIIWSVIPLDLTISLTELYHKYKRGQVILVPFTYPYESASDIAYHFFADIVVFVPVGLWAATARPIRIPGLPPLLVAAGIGAMVAGAIEFAQLLVLSRYTDVTDVVLGTTGAALGAWIAFRGDRAARAPAASVKRPPQLRRALPWLGIIAAYSVFLVAGFWFPFEITEDRQLIRARLDAFFKLPFWSLYVGNEFNAIKQSLIRLLLFAPLGALWAQVAGLARTSIGRRFVAAVGLTCSVVLAFGIELGQVPMPSKVADFTEVALCTAGVVGGLLVAAKVLGTAGDADPR